MDAGTHTNTEFLTGLVFGFDIGTASLGYAVRRGDTILEAGTLIFPEETGDLSDRRSSRRQRRTMRSRKIRLRVLRQRLEAAGLPRSTTNCLGDAVQLRIKAVRGEPITPEELHAALYHLLRRRGYTNVPWANQDDVDREDKKEEGQVRAAVEGVRGEMREHGEECPCECLDRWTREGRAQRGKSTERVIFPRDLIQKEFRAIVDAQSIRHPELARMADEIIYGPPDFGRDVNGFRVYFKKTDAPRAGALALYWPRFDNRGPGLDRFQERDSQGRPLHRARRNLDTDKAALGQFYLALQNYRLMIPSSRMLVDPPQALRDAFVEMWKDKGSITDKAQERLVETHAPHLDLLRNPNGKPLLSLTKAKLSGGGRSAYSRPTLEWIADATADGRRFDPPQPRLMQEGESREEAIQRRLGGIAHPLVRHRAEEYVRLLHQLVSRHGKPDLVVVEAVRDIAVGAEAKKKIQRIQGQNEQRRKQAEEKLEELGLSTAGGKNVKLASLLQETAWTCPYCLKAVAQSDIRDEQVEIDHIVPRSRFPSNDWNNLTAAHYNCNQKKGNRTPSEAFGSDPLWPSIEERIAAWFRPKKQALFLSGDPESLVEQGARLAETAYVARVLRGLTCLKLKWETEDGRDPSAEPGSVPRFQVTNGQLTSYLRGAWGLNKALHPIGSTATDEDREDTHKKNRADLRHHALDAMVIASTLPWAARRRRDGKDDHDAFDNPAHLDFDSVRAWVNEDRIAITFRSPAGWHRKHYNTTLLGRREMDDKPAFVAREALSGMFDESGKPKGKKSKDIYPTQLGEYIRTAAAQHPSDFLARLCFSEFQRWREEYDRTGEAPAISLPRPESVRIPIRSVRVARAKDPEGLMRLRPKQEGGPWVERTEFREVRIYKQGVELEPVFVPHSRQDPLYKKAMKREKEMGRPIKVIRRGEIVNIKDVASFPGGRYRIVKLGRTNAKIVPYFASGEPTALEAMGLTKSGGIGLNSLIRALDDL